MSRSSEQRQERRNGSTNTPISAELKQEGLAQLENEIQLIEGWLADLQGTREDNSASILARKSYQDMLQSRKDLLKALKQQ